MLERRVGEDCHRIGSADAIVCTQCRITCRHPFAIDVGIDRVFGEVVLDMAILLRHHIDVRLQSHHRTTFEPWSSRLRDEDIARSVVLGLQSQTVSQRKQILLYRLSMEGRARYLSQVIEVAPHGRGRQGLDFSSHSRFVLKMNDDSYGQSASARSMVRLRV